MLKKRLSFLSPERFVTVPYQVAMLIISALLILYLTIKVLIFEFYPIEKHPELMELTQEVEQKWGTKPVHVKTGMTILNFFEFDALKNEFKLNVLVWFEYDPKKIDIKTINKFIFVGATATPQSDPVIEDGPEGTKIVKHHLWLEFKAELLFRRFPVDDHFIYLSLTNDGAKPGELVYESDQKDFRLFNQIRTGGWKIAYRDVQSGFIQTQIGQSVVAEQPLVVFSIGVSKEDVRQTFLILLPLLFLFYLAIFSMSIANALSALNSAQAAVAGVLAYSFVMQTLSPPVGYFMISDYVFILLLASTFITYLVSMLNAGMEYDQSLTRQVFDRIKGIIIIVLYILLLSSFYYLFLYKDLHHYNDWMHKKKMEVPVQLPAV